MATGAELWRLPATQVVHLLKTKQVSPQDLLDVTERRIQETNGAVNAVPITCFPRARAAAKTLMDKGYPKKAKRGYLYGLPIVVKDLTAVEGVQFTEGCQLFKNRVAARSDPLVEVLEDCGAIVIGKSNTPELGTGANTFNEVFGPTYNPWNTKLSAGGSSGGSAAALASGMAWLATGTDLGGSLRIPAAFCGVVGFRPPIGRVPQDQGLAGFKKRRGDAKLTSVSGPMGRTVEDVALMLDAMACQHKRDPWSRPHPPKSYLSDLDAGLRSRMAWSPNLGVCPVDPEIAEVCGNAVKWFESQGTEVVEDAPDFAKAQSVFQVLRAASFRNFEAMVQEPRRSLIKPELVWQIEKGLSLTTEEISSAEREYNVMMRSVRSFFSKVPLLACPCVMTPPFDVNTRWVRKVEGVEFDNYIDWLMMTYIISLTNLPAISIPCGHTKEGLPVGLQIVGPPDGEAIVLAAASAFEKGHSFKEAVPRDPDQKMESQAQSLPEGMYA